jgi:hypothetical protein
MLRRMSATCGTSIIAIRGGRGTDEVEEVRVVAEQVRVPREEVGSLRDTGRGPCGAWRPFSDAPCRPYVPCALVCRSGGQYGIAGSDPDTSGCRL